MSALAIARMTSDEKTIDILNKKRDNERNAILDERFQKLKNTAKFSVTAMFGADSLVLYCIYDFIQFYLFYFFC